MLPFFVLFDDIINQFGHPDTVSNGFVHDKPDLRCIPKIDLLCKTASDISFGTVQPGFEPLTNPYITCLVHPDLPHEYRFKNCTDVGGERGDEWVIDKDCWVTVIYAAPKGKLPKTGN